MRFSQTLHLLSNKGRIENNGGGKRCVELEKLSAVREKELVSFVLSIMGEMEKELVGTVKKNNS